ncbi:MAG: FkbM family methyltransferase [Verrucomicrobia bacterium]|nr:FkbM family methyltransferase [Verrucomicrobiota bacterium]MBV8375726.1 FkbM family methyltransferase [Verrucomicrobiota bacterium]
MHTRLVKVRNRTFEISGDDDYLKEMGQEFEPDNVRFLARLCDSDSRVLDVGANIGMTALALSQICPHGRIAAIEPVPRTFEHLRRNVARANAGNIEVLNFALGSKRGTALMQGHPSNFACSFIADSYNIPDADHFSYEVTVKRLDETFGELSLDRLDFLKVDVEGFELEVFEGAKETLNTYRPIVFLEMNHWCLNIYRQMSIPEFRNRLLAYFPCLFAIDGLEYLDYADQKNVHHINYYHVLNFRFMNLVAGFDRQDILARLSAV